MQSQKHRQEKRTFTKKVLNIYVRGFLATDLGAGEMITVFDLVKYNQDGPSRIIRLVEEECTKALTKHEMKEATHLIEDYPYVSDDDNHLNFTVLG